MTGNITQCYDKLKFKVDINQNIKVFTEDEIKRITSNFSIPIGQGGFGEVYKGTLDDDYDLVAVKRYISKDLRKEFMEEVSIHSQMSHRNVVELIGYCIGESTLMIVTKYISKGNLDDILHNSDISIPLDVRLGIAIGCADALSYMHSMHLSNGNLIYHGDIKPANILLDSNLTSKLSDFGVSRLLSGGVTQYTVHIKGSVSYMDPIYFHEGCLTPRSDVYSFGMVLLELIARKRVRKGDINLIGGGEIFDAEIANRSNMKILKEMRKLAIECLTLDIHKRPQMNVVAKRLRTLKKELKDLHGRYSEHILASHRSWRKNDNQGPSYNSRMQLKKSLSIFKRNLSNSSKILLGLGNMRIFTQEELNEITQNYSCLLSGGTSGKVYKGTLEDNTVVAVRIFSEVLEGFEEAFINGGMILSQIVHKNIIRLLGYCLNADCPAFVYEYAARGTLSDILDGREDFPLHLRVKIAVETAEALEYLHSSAAGMIRHGYVAPSKTLVDDSFTPKLTGFSWAQRLNNDDSAIHDHDKYCVSLKLKTDVYQFGVLVLTLISRKNFAFYADHEHLVLQFLAAYKADNSGRAFFDDDITTRSEDVALLEEIGKLLHKCICLEIDQRPTMKQVAQHLRIIRRCWKNNCTADGASLVVVTN
ncbi:wall-associated receptor kinase 5-like [Oryza glaberrima]|uniref:Protein kinase domain-containing protein n=2 Tax=Oryza TaxID=4527 RepID=A0A0D3HAJ7_9ORYZ|nr:wall-associated receptor kinase 5-like [Oryza glaberrima]XP_052134713.1 wall-associated receptor kinase 5-like [Oryza glaberrima]